MKFTASIAALAAVSSAAAQAITPEYIGEELLSYLSPSCQATVISTLNSSLAQCLHVTSLLPAITTNGSVIPPVDNYLSTVCSSSPCSNATLTTAAQSIVANCSSDLSLFGIANSTVYEVFGLYPLAREVACLKTTAPFSAANASIPINSTAYNSTNGTFCVTSLATELSSYLGVNLTNSYIDTAALGGNSTTLNLLEMLPPTALCSDCIFAAADLIDEYYPAFGNISLGKNVTVMSYLDSDCKGKFNVTSNGSLPTTIRESAINSTFPFNVTAGNVTYPAASGASKPAPLNTSIAIRDLKARWIGQA